MKPKNTHDCQKAIGKETIPMRKTALLGLLTLLLFFGVVGCDLFGTTTATSTTTASTTTTTSLPASDTTVSTTESELEVRLLSIYQLAVSSGSFTGTYEEWLESVRGPAGREIALRVSGGFVQWQYAGETVWNDLVALTALVGPAGQNGQTPTFRVSGTKLQWQYAGQATWTDLFDLSVLTGGSGTDGKEIALRAEGGFLQWQREGDLVWTNLIDLSTLIAQPTISISVDGFWVINGVKTDYPATAQILPQTVDVVFEPNGGTMPEGFALTIQVPKGDAIDLPIPVKDGYVFLGWITGEGIHDIRYNNYTPFVRDTTLFALWKQDNEALLAFLAAPLSMNYTGRKTLLVQATIDGNIVTFDQSGEMKIVQKDGWTYRTYLDQERDLIDGAWVVRHREEGFVQIQTLKTDELAQAVKFQFYDGKWQLRSEWDQVRNETGFELFDPELFVKRPGENKYDYPITDEQLKLYGVPVGDEVVLSKVECYFDMDLQEIVILLEGMAKMDSDTLHPVVASLRLALYDVGTTIVDVPMEAARETVRQEIQAWTDAVMNRGEYQAAFPYSKQAFANLVDGYLMEIVGAKNLTELLVIRQNAEPAILSFAFEYNFLDLQKAARIEEILNHLDWQCGRATAESCDAMRAYFETSKSLILSAQSEPELQSAVTMIYDGIRSRYVEDPTALALQMHKERLKEFVDAYFEVLNPYLLDPSVKMTVTMLVNQAKAAIDGAPDTLAADQAFDFFHASLVGLDLSFGDWSQAKNFLLAQIAVWGTWIDTFAAGGYALPQDIKTEFEADYAMLGQVPDLLLLMRLSIETYVKYETSLMPLVRQWGLAAADQIKNDAAPSVPAEWIDDFDQAYASARQRIQNAKGPWDVQAAIDDFLQFVANLPQDDWQSLLNVAIQSLRVRVDELALEDLEVVSHQAIANLFLFAQEAILKIPDGQIDQLNGAVDAWQQAITRAVLPAAPIDDALALQNAKEAKRAFLLDIHAYTVATLAPGESTAPMDQWLSGYLNAVDAAGSLAELNSAVGDIVTPWKNLNLTYQTDLSWLRNDFLLLLDAYYQSGLPYVSGYSVSTETTFSNIRNNLETQTDPVFLIMSGVSAKSILPNLVRSEVRAHSLVLLEAIRTQWTGIVRSDALLVLDQLKGIFEIKMNRAIEPEDIAVILDFYRQTAPLLPKDAFKQAVQNAVAELSNLHHGLFATATAESRVALDQALIDGIASLQSAADPAELELRLTQAKTALHQAYLVDADLWQLQIYRDYYREIGKRIIESVMLYAGSEELEPLMMASYADMIDQWAIDGNPDDMYLHYQAWIEYLDFLHFEYQIDMPNLLNELNVALAMEIDEIYAHGLAGIPELVDIATYWTTTLAASPNEILAIANRHMSYYSVLDKAYVIVYDRAVSELATLYAQYQAVVAVESQPMLEAMHQAALNQLRTNPDRFDHGWVIHDFHQRAQTLL
jgi:hypothetical protein